MSLTSRTLSLAVFTSSTAATPSPTISSPADETINARVRDSIDAFLKWDVFERDGKRYDLPNLLFRGLRICEVRGDARPFLDSFAPNVINCLNSDTIDALLGGVRTLCDRVSNNEEPVGEVQQAYLRRMLAAMQKVPSIATQVSAIHLPDCPDRISGWLNHNSRTA